MKKDSIKYQGEKGFTLIEMMIAVAIIGILAAIAYPSYQHYIQKGNRVEARNLLQSAAQRLEANFTVNRTYKYLDQDHTQVINDETLKTWVGESDNYTIGFADGPEAQSYKLQAVPKNSSIQKKDECKTFTIDHRNVKTAGDETDPRGEKSIKCWQK